MPPLTFHLIPHTHWDREWYLPEAAFRARLVAMVDDLVDRLERDTGFRSFLLDGQTILLEDYLRVRPDRAAKLRALIEAGRLQTGPWYVLADEQIPSGEALVRNLLLGRADAERLGGRSDVLYSPDAFGHPAVWPDLAREFGIAHGVLWRGLGGERGQEHDLYRWRGPAGGAVGLYHLPPQGYEVGSALAVDPNRLAAAWRQIRRPLVARAAGEHVAVFLGADHHWAQPDIGRLRDRLALLEPEHEVRVSRLDEFCRAAFSSARALPILEGELRWSYGYTWTLQGVHATRAHLKRRNSEAEVRLERIVEPLAAMAGAREEIDCRPHLAAAWRTLLENQFHDSICGSATDVVAEAMACRFAEVEAMAGEIRRRAFHHLVGHSPDRARDESASAHPNLVLWNPGARTRAGVAIAELSFFRRDVLVGPPGTRRPRHGSGYRPFSLRTGAGDVLPVQVLGRRITQRRLDADRHYPDQDEVDLVRVAVRAPAVAGLGFTRLDPEPAQRAPSGGVSVRGGALSNALLQASLAPGGALRLVDRRTGERFVDLLRLESGGDVGDTYTWCPPPADRIRRSESPPRTRVLARGPLVGVIEGRSALSAGRGVGRRGAGQVSARLVVRLHDDSPLVHCQLVIDNQAADHRLRLRLPLGLGGFPIVTGTQFGTMLRHPVDTIDLVRYPDERPVTTAPAHRFAAAACGRRGLAVLAPGFFEIEWTETGDLMVTVLRAVGQLSRGDLPTRPGHAGWPEPTPLAQCLGVHQLHLALVPIVEDDLRRGDALPRLWEDAFLPVAAEWLPDAPLALPEDAIELEGEGLVLSAIKPAEESSGIVLRCYNPTGAHVSGKWRFGVTRQRASLVRADERGPIPVPLLERGRCLPFEAPPGAWVTHHIG